MPTQGVIDCHLHVIGDGVAHPYMASAAYRPEPAPLGALTAVLDKWKIKHAVLVQVSVHGTDNGLLLESLEQDRTRFRGVAVTGPVPGDVLLARLKQAGVVGLRLNLFHGGGPAAADLDRYAALCRDNGLHLQIYVNGLLLPEMAAVLRRLRTTLVFDHFGGLPADLDLSHPALLALLGLLNDGAWVKLSAPYRVSSEDAGFEDTIPLGRRLMEAAPDRCVWGSDWPHVATDKTIHLDQLFRLAGTMARSGAESEAIFFDNAKRLYGF